ncbi:winged helix-turn-helix transcriptional regulator [Mesobacillus boroniphilus]|uniref:Winged helix-turn-helix transcriptional regulator n=1 Tax=Mesobacillus boroniphilus TaxID=308892 RepID=A0A944GXG5_9BACI|nr:phosphotransferase [Mesobacillus boroniphilus]MBS8265747.1 winged helix-turn-helix transcriptional regulator [Mesobacillus boroniphilus]
MEHLIKLLEAINKNNNVSQKKLSDLNDISIGKVNYLIQEMLEKGLIYNEKKGRNMNYFLTPKGIEYLQQQIGSYQDKKVNIHYTDVKKEITQAVILAGGLRKDFNCPAGMLKVEDKELIKRNIEILQEIGITKFVIVTGYMKDAFRELEDFANITFVENKRYKWTGSMASLACAFEHITDDFLLLEDDLLIEERAIKELAASPLRDCVLITNESGSGDEAFVEIRNGFLYKVSKDIHQFNRIDGEMIGASKLSLDVFHMMVRDYEQHNRNPYMNYEYMLLDISRNFNIGYLKLFNIVWAEADSQEQFYDIKQKIFPMLKRKEAEFRENQIKGYLSAALGIEPDEVTGIQAFGGMTNKNYKVTIGDKEYVLRVPGNGTEKMISRSEEKVNSSLASELGIDTELLYFNDETGIKVSELIPNAETLNSKTAKREDYMTLTAGILNKLHHSGIKMANTFNVFEKIEEYELLLKEVNGSTYSGYEEVKSQVMKLKQQFDAMVFDFVPCHNDTVPENFVKSGEEGIYLIDWEYGGMNDPMWDIAAHSLECNFSSEEEELFLTIYLDQELIPGEIKKRILMNKIYQDLLWSVWTNIKEAKGDDFGNYGIDRFNRVKENLTNPLLTEKTYELKK